jgi:hypothetical protein
VTIPTDVVLEILPAAVAGGLVLLAAFPWRKQAWPAALAIGAGFALAFWYIRAKTLPPLVPKDTTLLVFHFAIGAKLLALVTAIPKLPAAGRWSIRVGACAAVTWLLRRGVAARKWPADATRALWLVGLATGLLVVWTGAAWRADRVRGYPAPLALLITAAASGHAIGNWGGSGVLAQYAGAVAAALGAVTFFAAFDRERRLAGGAVGVAVLLLGAVWISAVFFARLPRMSAVLFALAPVWLFPRPRWAGPAVAAAFAAGALYLAWQGRTVDPYEGY